MYYQKLNNFYFDIFQIDYLLILFIFHAMKVNYLLILQRMVLIFHLSLTFFIIKLIKKVRYHKLYQIFSYVYVNYLV